ncbi:hypothetical protein ABB02_00824 [Clostridiaceae bacterium JG1575]|nr:hypothetical protein ABB02_00824 [Clostridiaceae bacterium JG1575]
MERGAPTSESKRRAKTKLKFRPKGNELMMGVPLLEQHTSLVMVSHTAQ